MLVSANDILLSRLLHNARMNLKYSKKYTGVRFPLSEYHNAPAAYVPIVGIRRRIASPSLVKTFRFRISHRVALRRGRYAAFWSCRRRFRAGIVVYRPSDPLRQKWILKNRNEIRSRHFSVLCLSNPRGWDVEYSLANRSCTSIKMQIRFNRSSGRVSMRMNDRGRKNHLDKSWKVDSIVNFECKNMVSWK